MNTKEMDEPRSWALLTDLYELTMAHGYWHQGLSERESVFHLSFRENPFGGSYSIACGLLTICEMLHDYRFHSADLQYLASLQGIDSKPLFPEPFLNYLGGMRFSCDIDAIPEGTVVFPHQPLVRVRGPLLQAQIIESMLLCVINFQTLVATKSARICRAAAPGSVLEFGLRRAQGDSGAMLASRAAYIGGCGATSNVLAGRRYGIPVRGTHAHSWVMSFDDELESFEKYAEAMPNNCIFLVDTYDTHAGVANAIKVARKMHAVGHRMVGIRLDSGDLATLSRDARQMLNDAGLAEALIVASNDLDEYEISALKRQGAAIDIWGVGTRLATAYDQPALGGVYKLSALRDSSDRWQPKVKRSEQPIKMSTPGILQTRRYLRKGIPCGDVTYDELMGEQLSGEVVTNGGSTTTIPGDSDYRELLTPVFRNGELVYQSPSIHSIRDRAIQQLDQFGDLVSDRSEEGGYHVGLERQLYERKLQLGASKETGQ